MYPIQLDDGRIWKWHIDHILKDRENRKHDEVAPKADDWVYGMPFKDKPRVPVAEGRVVTNTELPSRYPTRNRRAPDRLIEHANCKTYVCVYNQRWGSYFLKVTHYLLLLPVAKSNLSQLHIT